MTVMQPDQFAKLLRQLADMIETGDSLEGSLQYTYAEWPHQDKGLQIEAALRTGNLQGQGGMLLL